MCGVSVIWSVCSKWLKIEYKVSEGIPHEAMIRALVGSLVSQGITTLSGYMAVDGNNPELLGVALANVIASKAGLHQKMVGAPAVKVLVVFLCIISLSSCAPFTAFMASNAGQATVALADLGLNVAAAKGKISPGDNVAIQRGLAIVTNPADPTSLKVFSLAELGLNTAVSKGVIKQGDALLIQEAGVILREPGHIIIDAAGTPATFYSEAPWTVEMMEEVVALPSSMFGDLDRIPVGRLVKIKGIVQQFSDGAVAKLYPFAAKARGASILASTDKTLDIHTTSGKRCRIPNGFVYKEPDIRGDVRKTPLGEVEFWGIVPLSGNGNALANFFAETSVSYPGDSLFDTSAIITPAWSVSLGTTAIDLADSGFTLKTTPKLVEDKINGVGTYNVAIVDYGVEIELEPMNLTRATVMAMAGWGTALGGRKSASGMEIVCQGTGIYVAVRGAALVPGANFSFGAEPRAVGKLKFQSTRSFDTGVEVAQLYVGESEPA